VTETRTRLRPLLFDEEILTEVADRLVNPVMTSSSFDPSEEHAVRAALREVLQDAADFDDLDGFQLAKALEGFAWRPHARMVEDLDMATPFLHRAHEEAVKRWVEEEKIEPRFGIGDEVVVELDGAARPAAVREVLRDTAQYCVLLKTPLDDDARAYNRGSHAIPYEDVYEPQAGSLSGRKATPESNTPA
jgi:hypothetical protein